MSTFWNNRCIVPNTLLSLILCLGAAFPVVAAPDFDPPSKPTIIFPADGSVVAISGDPATEFIPRWNPSTDADGDILTYTWQVWFGPLTIYTQDAGTDTQVVLTIGQLHELLSARGFGPGKSVTLGHRVLVTDGVDVVASSFAEVRLDVGELNSPPAKVEDLMPNMGSSVIVQGDPADMAFTASWTAAVDPEMDPVTYTWQLAAEMDFATVVLEKPGITELSTSLTVGEMNDALRTGMGVAGGSTRLVYHRILASDGTNSPVAGPAESIMVTRGAVTATEWAGQATHNMSLSVYPNPFTSSVTFGMGASGLSQFSYRIYNVLGEDVTGVVTENAKTPAGEIVVGTWDLPRGVYFYRVTTPTATFTGKIVRTNQ